MTRISAPTEMENGPPAVPVKIAGLPCPDISVRTLVHAGPRTNSSRMRNACTGGWGVSDNLRTNALNCSSSCHPSGGRSSPKLLATESKLIDPAVLTKTSSFKTARSD